MAEELLDEFTNPTHMRGADAYMNLIEGNVEFLANHDKDGEVSPALVEKLFHEGQAPFAAVVSCSDSRVVPEHVFMCRLGDLFTIRSVGGYVGDSEIASVVYACDQLNVKLVVVMGHTHCGLINAAIEGSDMDSAALTPIVKATAYALEGETDQYEAAVKAVRANIARLTANEEVATLIAESGVKIRGAVYMTENGQVKFLED